MLLYDIFKRIPSNNFIFNLYIRRICQHIFPVVRLFPFLVKDLTSGSEDSALGQLFVHTDGKLRFSPHWPNHPDEVETVLAVVDELLA